MAREEGEKNHLDSVGGFGYSAVSYGRRAGLVRKKIRNYAAAHDSGRAGSGSFKLCLAFVFPRLAKLSIS